MPENNRENRIGWGKVCRWAGIWIRLSLFTLFILTEPLVVEAAGQSVTLRLENVSLKEAFKDKIYHERYDEVYNIFVHYLSLNKDPKTLLSCLKEASLETRENQTLESMKEEARMLSRIFSALKAQQLLTKKDANYVEEYVEDYRRVGNK